MQVPQAGLTNVEIVQAPADGRYAGQNMDNAKCIG